jgi:hypothetical protein
MRPLSEMRVAMAVWLVPGLLLAGAILLGWRLLF